MDHNETLLALFAPLEGESLLDAAQRIKKRNIELEKTLERIQKEFSATELGNVRHHVLEKLKELPDNEYRVGECSTLSWIGCLIDNAENAYWSGYHKGWRRGTQGLPLHEEKNEKKTHSSEE